VLNQIKGRWKRWKRNNKVVDEGERRRSKKTSSSENGFAVYANKLKFS
jgi:hypothetical protein